ncbi:hypothetical protein [Rhizobium sp. NPDC090279]|uniref:hypothetical protein n=1 Tax=Rhizobium sp. NPDC090279 TaxID=3364499 RepID=UPI00383A7A85
MRYLWDRYGWLLCIAALTFFFSRMLWGEPTFCGTAEGQCLRSWVSATGGWLAILAAIPTITYLSRQVNAAVKANENNAKIQLRRNYALSKKAKNRSDLLDMHANAFLTILDKRIPDFAIRPPTRRQAIQRMSAINALLTDGTFDKFEEEIEFPDQHNAEQLRHHIKLFTDMTISTDDPLLSEEARTLIVVICGMSRKYATDCKAASEIFIIEANEMMGRDQDRDPVGDG